MCCRQCLKESLCVNDVRTSAVSSESRHRGSVCIYVSVSQCYRTILPYVVSVSVIATLLYQKYPQKEAPLSVQRSDSCRQSCSMKGLTAPVSVPGVKPVRAPDSLQTYHRAPAAGRQRAVTSVHRCTARRRAPGARPSDRSVCRAARTAPGSGLRAPGGGRRRAAGFRRHRRRYRCSPPPPPPPPAPAAAPPTRLCHRRDYRPPRTATGCRYYDSTLQLGQYKEWMEAAGRTGLA